VTDRTRWRRAAIGAVVLVAVQAAIVLVYTTRDGARRKPAPSRFPVEPVSGEVAVEAFVLERQDGTPWKLDTLQGQPVVLHFWATWCRPCRYELPTLLAQRDRIRRAGAELVLVSVDDEWDDIRTFFDGAVPAEVSRALDDDYRQVTTGVLPETLVVDRGGKLTTRVRGARDWGSATAATFLDSLERSDDR